MPGKNLKTLGGLPLLAHSIQYALENSDLISEVFVSTDDQEIAAVATNFGAVVIKRPAALSGDEQPTVSALQHVLEHCGGAVENVVLLQPTNPLRPKDLFREAYQTFLKLDCKSLFTVSRSHQKLGKIELDRFIPFNYSPGQRSQDMEPLYYENGLLYICSARLVSCGTLMPPEAFPLLVDHEFAGVDIDTNEDLEYARYLYTKHKL